MIEIENYKNILSKKDDEIREQLAWLLQRGILVVYETKPKVDIIGNELEISYRIGLQVETEKYIEKLERIAEAAEQIATHVFIGYGLKQLENALKEWKGE